MFSVPRHSVSCDVNHINIDGHDIVPAKTLKSRCYLNICKTSLFHLKNTSNIHSFLPDKAAVQLTHAFVSSQLDYCNSLLQGLPSCSIRRLQSIQNITARILKRTHTYQHITPILSPAYIQQLITPYVSACKLRSEDMSTQCTIQQAATIWWKEFQYRAAPVMWSNLPDNIQKALYLVTFKTNLKTHLFKLSFE